MRGVVSADGGRGGAEVRLVVDESNLEELLKMLNI